MTDQNQAPLPANGTYADGFGPLAHRFAEQLRNGSEIGAGLCVYQRGRCVADLWGGLADVSAARPWKHDTRVVVFSVTKGLTAMGLNMLADRGQLDWDEPVATYWPGFAEAGKGSITMRTLFNHQAGLAALDHPVTLADCARPEGAPDLRRALEVQRPAWEPGHGQGYHAITFGMYARELFERITGEPAGRFLQRELFDPLNASVSIGTPASEDENIAQLYPPATAQRLVHLLIEGIRGGSIESRVARAIVARESLTRRAFGNPRMGRTGLAEYNDVPVRRAELLWASATATARGLARAYLPFASGGTFEGRTYLKASTLEPIHRRQGWSERDLVLQKALGWSQGFLKEETHLFSPNPESFGHAGMGGALGWCDPAADVTFGYVMNGMDWRIRSPRALALCRELYACEPMRS